MDRDQLRDLISGKDREEREIFDPQAGAGGVDRMKVSYFYVSSSWVPGTSLVTNKKGERNYNPPDWAPATAQTEVDELAPLSAKDKGGEAHHVIGFEMSQFPVETANGLAYASQEHNVRFLKSMGSFKNTPDRQH